MRDIKSERSRIAGLLGHLREELDESEMALIVVVTREGSCAFASTMTRESSIEVLRKQVDSLSEGQGRVEVAGPLPNAPGSRGLS